MHMYFPCRICEIHFSRNSEANIQAQGNRFTLTVARIFFGKNKVLVKALGSTPSDSAIEDSYRLGKVCSFAR